MPVSPFGSWPSPLSAARVTAGALRLDQIQLDGRDVYWLEGRASEGGRNVVVCNGDDVTPQGFNVRSRVHEYGGAAYTVHNGTVFFSNFADQRIYQQQRGNAPEPITEAGPCYADFRMDATRSRLIGVREHNGENAIVAIPTATAAAGKPGVLVEGADFYSDPIVRPDGKFLAWLEWRHPNMPWDGTDLWVALFKADGSVGARRHVAGGRAESIFQPEWAPDGRLYFVSDRTGWWNLYRWSPSTSLRAGGDPSEAVHPMAAEFGKPQWTFSMVTYAFAGRTQIAATYTEGGRWKLGLINTETRQFEAVDLGGTEPIESIRSRATEGAEGSEVFFVGGSPTQPLAVMTASGTILRSSSSDTITRDWISVPEAVTYRVKDRDVHAFYYPPTNPDLQAPPGEKPPLLVVTHGGPTGATLDVLDPKVQFWTSRGFAVLDVNYSGSTGYGRPYRDRLRGQWGIADVEDAVGGAQAMVAMGRADANRLIVRGGSAGGYTTLAALTFHDTFKAGASYYGISDLEVLQVDTHKFESRYNDTLIGPYPDARDTYRARSPIHFTDRLSCPIILFQGLEDKVVPPNQSERMAEAVRRKGLKVKYVAFEGEQHGFRKAENIIRSLEEELAFYRDVFGMAPA
ncbi:MAG: S9 family peptidase [Acidimicrobiia bacterium]|nr:S9 family peptidase [Acidimicrobiia bacterium]